jgi:outer membrane protein
MRVSVAALFSMLAAAAPLAAQAVGAGAPQKFAYVDTRMILEQAPGRTEIEAVLQKEVDAMQVEVKRMQDSLQAMMTKFDKDQATLTLVEKEARTKSLAQKQSEYQQRTQELQSKAQARQQELVQPLLDQVKLVLEDVRQELGYAMVFDIGGQGASIVAADKNLNISDRVIAKLRTMPAPKVAAKTDSAVKKPAVGAPLQAPAGVKPPSGKPDSE